MVVQHKADFIEAGQGQKVILLHSSVAGAKQWTRLIDQLSDRFHVVAINLIGYGNTPNWHAPPKQTLQDQAALVEPFLPADTKAYIVGHSFGGSVAMKAAAMFNGRVDRLVLIEPNPFNLLRQHNSDAYQDAMLLQDVIKKSGETGDWLTAAQVFADYWTGAGSWDRMPEPRQIKFAAALQPNFHEWDSIVNEVTTLNEWRTMLPADTTVICAKDTVRTIHEICELMQKSIPSWRYEQIEKGGHMAPLTHPDAVNPMIERALTRS